MKSHLLALANALRPRAGLGFDDLHPEHARRLDQVRARRRARAQALAKLGWKINVERLGAPPPAAGGTPPVKSGGAFSV